MQRSGNRGKSPCDPCHKLTAAPPTTTTTLPCKRIPPSFTFLPSTNVPLVGTGTVRPASTPPDNGQSNSFDSANNNTALPSGSHAFGLSSTCLRPVRSRPRRPRLCAGQLVAGWLHPTDLDFVQAVSYPLTWDLLRRRSDAFSTFSNAAAQAKTRRLRLCKPPALWPTTLYPTASSSSAYRSANRAARLSACGCPAHRTATGRRWHFSSDTRQPGQRWLRRRRWFTVLFEPDHSPSLCRPDSFDRPHGQ